jgi:hypothetical protein
MNQDQQRRLANFVVSRENMHHAGSADLRCMLADYQLMPNGGFMVEVQWHIWGPTDLKPESRMILLPAEVEDLRCVWGATVPNTGRIP